MLACYNSQGKQLASGVIGLLTCQSHYNVSVINTTPCARLLLHHPLAQRIPTDACECSVTQTPRCKSSASLTVPAALHSHLSKSHNHTHLIHSLYIICTPFTPFTVWSRPVW